MKAPSLLKIALALTLFLPALASAATVSPPVITPGSGVYFDSVEVAIFTATVGATIYYTTDGSVPTTDSEPFTLPFFLTDSTTVKAIAVRDGDTDSVVSTAVFDISPTEEIPTPTVTISGKKSLKTGKAKVKISGTATGATSVEYQVDDGDFKTAQGTAAWSFKVKLKPGKNVIYVYAVGEEEDSDPAKVTVTRIRKK